MNKIERTKQQIISAANKLFNQAGLSNINTSQIAKLAKIARATLYKYFHSKEEIFEAIVKKEIEDAIKNLKSLSELDDPIEKLRKYIELKVNFIGHFMRIYHKNIDDIRAILPEILSNYNELCRCEQKVLNEILLEGKKMGKFEIEDHNAVSQTIMAIIKGIGRLVLEDEYSESDAKRHIYTFEQLLLKAITI